MRRRFDSSGAATAEAVDETLARKTRAAGQRLEAALQGAAELMPGPPSPSPGRADVVRYSLVLNANGHGPPSTAGAGGELLSVSVDGPSFGGATDDEIRVSLVVETTNPDAVRWYAPDTWGLADREVPWEEIERQLAIHQPPPA